MLGSCSRAVPRLRWRTAPSTNSASARCFTFHPDLPVMIVGWWGMNRTSRYIFWGLITTQTNRRVGLGKPLPAYSPPYRPCLVLGSHDGDFRTPRGIPHSGLSLPAEFFFSCFSLARRAYLELSRIEFVSYAVRVGDVCSPYGVVLEGRGRLHIPECRELRFRSQTIIPVVAAMANPTASRAMAAHRIGSPRIVIQHQRGLISAATEISAGPF